MAKKIKVQGGRVDMSAKLIKQTEGIFGGLGTILAREGDASFCTERQVAVLPVSHNGNKLDLVYCGKELGLQNSGDEVISTYTMFSMRNLPGAVSRFTSDLKSKYAN